MPALERFEARHITKALALWRDVENIGLSSADEPDQIASFLARNPGFSFVAIDDGQLVGACLCGHDGRRGYVHHLAVHEAHRKTGLGSELLTHSLDALRSSGIRKCHAFVFHSNPYADLFWTPQGWERRDDLLVYSKHTSDRT